DKWTVRNPSSTGCTIQIFDLKGQQLYQVLTSSQSHTIDATDFAAGIYLAKIQSGANEQTVRLVKH
ncbi:T9SS type A sorting domain-containing protein, partial [Schleiferiaceae bacterium]|nr:T9SS type A sorting domain-containing protein [Schleiferiaceae bacterium]